MHKVDVMYDLELEYLFDEGDDGKKCISNKGKGKHVMVSDKIFNLMLKEGLIKKTDDGFIFVGKYEDTLKMIRKN